MIDYGEKFTDEQIRKLEHRIDQTYKQAAQELQQKLDEHWAKFKIKDKIKRSKVESGELTQQQYDNWIAGQVFQGKQWERKRDSMVATLRDATLTCNSMINDATPSVFAENANYIGWQVEHSLGIDMGFNLYNEQAVRRLLVEEPNILPLKKVKGEDYVTKVERWSEKTINRHIVQGILQGEGYKSIAERIQAATGMEAVYAKTNTRTAMTSAQNAGRVQTMKNLEEQGLKMLKVWNALGDGRTRPAHVSLNGQAVPVNSKFNYAGFELDYPADPNGLPSLVYNCRCRVEYKVDPKSRSQVTKMRLQAVEQGWNPKSMSFEKWLTEKNKIVVRTGENHQEREIGRDKNSTEQIKRGDTLFIATKVTGTVNDIYVSDKSEYLKPKQIRFIDNMITNSQKILGISGQENLPRVIIADATELNTNAIASYNYGMNKIFINNVARSKETLIPAQSQFTCSENILSSSVHEYIHWKDTQEYIRINGKIDDGYIHWIRGKSKKKLENLSQKGYNIESISDYAKSSMNDLNYDEIYTEYRTKKLLEVK